MRTRLRSPRPARVGHAALRRVLDLEVVEGLAACGAGQSAHASDTPWPDWLQGRLTAVDVVRGQLGDRALVQLMERRRGEGADGERDEHGEGGRESHREGGLSLGVWKVKCGLES